MKKVLLTALVISGLMFVVSGCEKKDEVKVETTVTETTETTPAVEATETETTVTETTPAVEATETETTESTPAQAE